MFRPYDIYLFRLLTLQYGWNHSEDAECRVDCNEHVTLFLSDFVYENSFGFGHPLASRLQGIPCFGAGARRPNSLPGHYFHKVATPCSLLGSHRYQYL